MASERDRLKAWKNKVEAGDKVYREWADDFDVDSLEGYYTGIGQWQPEEKGNYTINMFFPTIEAKEPSLFFYRPRVRLRPLRGKGDDPGSVMDEIVRLYEDTAESFIADPAVGFETEIGLALHESNFKFGIIEVGYSADTIDNPNAGKPVLWEEMGESGEGPMETTDGQQVIHGKKLITNEGMWTRWIPAEQFRWSATKAHPILSRNEWVGYYEYVHLEDVKANPNYKNTASLKSRHKVKKPYAEIPTDTQDSDLQAQKEGLVKLWKVWNLRDKVKRVWCDESKDGFLLEEPFNVLPLAMLKFHNILGTLGPVPPTFNWKSPQDELNETRQMQKIHRKRYIRRYKVRQNTIDPEELRKLEDGEDGCYIEVQDMDTLAPVDDAPLDRAVAMSVPTSKEDFREASNTGGAQRGISESDTATEANIIQQNFMIRDIAGRRKVARFMGEVVYIMLELARERMALPFWIQRNVDPNSAGLLEESQRIMAVHEMIVAQQLEPIQYEVYIDFESMSPVTEAKEREDWNAVLGMLMQFPMLAFSDYLLRRTLAQYGIRGEREIREIQAFMLTMMEAQAQMAAADQDVQDAKDGKPRKGAPPPDDKGGAGQPAPQRDIMTQMEGQVGLGAQRPS